MYAGDHPPQLIVEANRGPNNPNYSVVFFTNVATQHVLHWGTTESIKDQIVESVAVREHVFRLTSLQANTKYFYRIDDQEILYNFTTPENTLNKFTFSAMSDIHIDSALAHNDKTEAILKQIVDSPIKSDALFLGGDYVDYGFTDTAWGKFLSIFTSTTSHIPVISTMGNHDNFFGGKGFYQSYFYPPAMEKSNGSSLYHQYKINGINIFVLDCEWDSDSYTMNSQQVSWFTNAISKVDPAEWTIVLTHAMMYSSGGEMMGFRWGDLQDMITTFEPMFKQYDVDMVLTGHNHHSEVLNASNIVYLVNGIGGGYLDNLREYTSPASLYYQNQVHGYTQFQITGNFCNLTMYSYTGDTLFTTVFAK
jgi:predicted MPP superfamily phosphohydrolase